MVKFLLAFTGFVIAFAMSILVMLFGWGLEPASWGWIIGGGLVSVLIGSLFSLIKLTTERSPKWHYATRHYPEAHPHLKCWK